MIDYEIRNYSSSLENRSMTTERWIRQSVLVLVTVFSYDLKLLGGGGTSYSIIYRLLNMREMYQRINDGIFYESQKFKSKI